ncbi:MAG: hypothetical protein ACMG57_05790 [Candidatus Dojkabacteria bacterium]
MKTTYEKIQVKGTFFTMRGFYLFFMPMMVPYNKLSGKAKEQGFVVKGGNKFNGIIEKSVSFGRGWIGEEIEDVQTSNANVIRINQEFNAYEYTGSYKGIGQAFKDIMIDFPKIIESYNLYLNDPQITPEDQLKTLILFR